MKYNKCIHYGVCEAECYPFCEHYKCTSEPKQKMEMTNYEKIKNMSAPEMAVFLYKILGNCDCMASRGGCKNCIYNSIDACLSARNMEKWLGALE